MSEERLLRRKSAIKESSSAGRCQPKRSPGDRGIVQSLQERARSLSANPDLAHKRTGEVLARFATTEGERLRRWIEGLADRQVAAAADYAESRMVSEEYGDAILDAEGRPAVIDPAEFLDSLAYWVSSREPAKRWQRSDLLDQVAAKSRELAELVERKDGPQWRAPIELFEQGARPKCVDGAFASFVRDVRNPLRRQGWPGLLRQLAEEAERVKRLGQMDTAVRYTPRPSAPGAWERRLAREIRDWFEIQCQVAGTPDVIADVINLWRTPALRSATEDVTGAQVIQWLRPGRRKLTRPKV